MKIQNIPYSILIADLLWMLVALKLGIELRVAGTRDALNVSAHVQAYSLMIVVAAVAWTYLYFEMNLDGFRGGWHLPAILSKVIVAVALLMVVVLSVGFITKHYYSRLILAYFFVLFSFGLVGVRYLVRFLVAFRLRNAADGRCVILGHGPIARELVTKIASHPEMRFQVVGFLFPAESEALNGFAGSLETPVTSVKTLQVLELLAQQKVQKLIIAMAYPNGAEVRKLVAGCRKASIQVYLVPPWYDLYVSRAQLEEIDGLPLLSFHEGKPPAISFALKRVIDVVLSLGILLFVSPLLAVAAIFVYGKKGKAFRTELRCGKNEIPFRMCRLNVERHATKPEPYERLFVRWSLTELPQLWNVLCGDMSLVGPRPEPPERVKHYSDWQRQRLKVHAGVTGLAQVHGLREQHSSEDKTRFDLQYIFRWSPFLDLSLILQTVWTLLFRGLSQEPVASQGATALTSSNEFITREVFDVNRS